MYALAAPTLFQSCRDYPDGFSAALDFALTADEIFDLYNNAPCGYHSLDAAGRILRINNTELKWLGYTRDELVGQQEFQDLIAPNSRKAYEQAVSSLPRRGAAPDVEIQLRRHDGTFLDVSVEFSPIFTDSGELGSIRARVFDISDKKRAEIGRRDQERFLDRVLMATPDIVYVVDVQTRCNVFANKETAKLLGYSPNEIAAMGEAMFERLIHPQDVPKVAAHIMRVLRANDDTVLETEYRMRRSDGDYRVFASRDTVFARTSDRTVTHYLGVAQDVTDKRAAERALADQVARLNDFAARIASQGDASEVENRNQLLLTHTDGLTGLANHRAFQERLQSEFEIARRDASPLSLLLIDLDDFRQFNESFGHHAGDDLLRSVTGVLSELTRDSDVCARYGGEEFAIVAAGADCDAAFQLAERIRRGVKSLNGPYRPVTVSIGVAALDSGAPLSPAYLVGLADEAVREAKQGGKNQVRAACCPSVSVCGES